ncbi:DUF2382 domain-containing protein [Microbacterium sp. APC 3898]|jgi:uncharacterized protein (TIGR02271 family)|uniref:DUF2382 domain-containing protein n=1 Tax=Planococcus notacanthi TaxID=3035188 RepID=A0ABT7ZKN8_9BACL|nr:MULTISPECIES: DUF2382 domain-containing protein [Terrabacteria group]MDN3427720.1 DUF2382 domain-containing protein [Planococcus sp. APC 4016]MDN3499272.1 DUF2382 domain-containing protein [Microbacterium sp. APC 3898]
MANNKFMGTFDSETEVLRKIEELKAQGSREEDMYVMARDKDQISMVRGRTDVDYKSSEGNWMDKFMGFLSGDEPTRQAFSGMGVDEAEADRYYKEVQNGKILLFVDREYGANYEGKAPYDNTSTSGAAGTMGAAGAAGASGLGSARTHKDDEAVGRDGLTVDTNEENDVYYNKKDDKFSSGTSETAGVGRDSGTGFGLGSDRTVDDVNRTDRFDDTNRDLNRTDTDLNRTGTEEEKLRLHEERLNVDKERVQTGEVNVGKHVVEENQTIEVPVEREEVYVERRPVNEETTGNSFDKDSGLTGDAYQEGENIHIPVTEERVEVTKKDVVAEEIVVGKRKVQDTETVNETVRREEADIDEDTNLTDDELTRKNRTDRTDRDRL